MPPLNLPAAATPPIQAQGQNPLEQLRLMQIMGGGTPPNQGSPTPMSAQGINPPMMGGYQPETGATDRFNEMLQNYPESENRGMLEKIALSMMALNDPRLVQQIMQQPSQEQEAWSAQIGPAQAAAGLEGSSNVNMRQIANMILTGRQAGEKIEISRAAQELNEWKAQNPNMQLKTREDGMIVGISPLDPTQVVETGVKSGDLSDQEKEDARIELEEAKETGRVSRAATATGEKKAAATLQEERLRGRPTKTTGAQSLEERRAISNRAQKIKNENPEWAKYIKIDGDEVTVTAPRGMLRRKIGGGLTRDMRQQILDAIYPDGESSSEEVMEKPIPDGSGIAISRDGGKTWQRK